MTQRHLLPSEIDMLVEGDAGDGTADLHAHVETCAGCRRRVREGRLIATTLETMIPHVRPKPGFADRIMTSVDVSQPWYAAALDAVGRFVPQSMPLRLAAGGLAVAGGAALTAGGAWIAMRADGAALLGSSAIERSKTQLASVTGDAMGTLFGDAAVNALRSGGLKALGIGAAVFIAALAVATAGFGTIVNSVKRRQEGAQ